MEKEYDVIIVGTGPAGGTIAAKMAEAGQKVLMLERGAYHTDWIMGKQIPCLLLFDKLGLCATKEGLMVARAITVGGSALVSCGAASRPYPKNPARILKNGEDSAVRNSYPAPGAIVVVPKNTRFTIVSTQTITCSNPHYILAVLENRRHFVTDEALRICRIVLVSDKTI